MAQPQPEPVKRPRGRPRKEITNEDGPPVEVEPSIEPRRLGVVKEEEQPDLTFYGISKEEEVEVEQQNVLGEVEDLSHELSVADLIEDEIPEKPVGWWGDVGKPIHYWEFYQKGLIIPRVGWLIERARTTGQWDLVFVRRNRLWYRSAVRFSDVPQKGCWTNRDSQS